MEKKKKDENVSPALIPTSKVSVSMMCKNKKRKATKIDSQGKKGEKNRNKGKRKCDSITQSEFVRSRPRRINVEKTDFNIMADGRVANYQVSCNDDYY